MSGGSSDDLRSRVPARSSRRAATAARALDVHVDDYVGWTSIGTTGTTSFLVRAPSPEKDSLAETKYQLVPFDFEQAVHALTNGQYDQFRALAWKHVSCATVWPSFSTSWAARA